MNQPRPKIRKIPKRFKLYYTNPTFLKNKGNPLKIRASNPLLNHFRTYPHEETAKMKQISPFFFPNLAANERSRTSKAAQIQTQTQWEEEHEFLGMNMMRLHHRSSRALLPSYTKQNNSLQRRRETEGPPTRSRPGQNSEV